MAATCRGLDVSAYQNAQDWAGHKADGVVFAFAKASEGQHTQDDMFARHITGIVKAGLVPGAYHYGWPTQDPEVEAANYIAAVKPYIVPGFLHWLDLERRTDGANYAGRTAAQIKTWATTWIATVQAAFPGQRVGVYTSSDDLSTGRIPAGVPLWYPAYTWGSTAVPYSKAEDAARPHPSGWSPLFWQFTSTPIDRSICYLSEADLRTWAAGTEPDMALTADDISKVATAAAKAVLTLDGVIAAPATAPDVKTNQYWALQSYIKDTNARLRAVQATETAQSAAIATLATTVTALAANTAELDPAALVAEIQAAINNVVIHLTTS